MPKYMVIVWKTEYYCAKVQVSAMNREDAENVALDDAREYTLDWSCDGVEYDACAIAHAVEKRDEKA
jgi:hypothetical protein